MKAFTETERQEFLAAKHVGVLSVAADGRPPASVLRFMTAMLQP